MKRLTTIALLFVLSTILLTIAGSIKAQTTISDTHALAYMPLNAVTESILENEAVDIYARLHGQADAYVLAGIPTQQTKQLQSISPGPRVLDTAVTPAPIIQSLIAAVDSADLMQYMGDISGQWPTMVGGQPYTIVTRNTDSGTPVAKAAQYIGEHLDTWGLDVTYHTWSATRPPNVIGEISGQTNPDDIYILSSHLDNMPSGSLAPGADDNGSGSVANLLAAQLFSQYEWDCTLRFAFWTGEEQGLLGSNVYAENMIAPGDNVLGVLNLDMIAHDAEGAPIVDLHTRSWLPGSTIIANTFVNVVDAYELPLQPQILENVNLGNYSDNKSFWDEGIAAILAIEDNDDFTPYYHTTQDTPSTLNVDYYEAFARAAVGTFAHMSNCLAPGQFAPPAAPIVGINQDDTAVNLSWPHRLANTHYEVHRHDTPYFVPNESTKLADLEPPFADDIVYSDTTSAIENPAINHTYAILAFNGNEDMIQSNRVAEFDYALNPTPVYGYEVVNTYPHDVQAFTQGLVYTDATLFEGTGLHGKSSLRRVELTTGAVLQQHDLDAQYFGEGITSFNDQLIQLTWQEQTGFVYDQATFDQLDTFSYPTEGWGLTHDGTHLIMSDGSDNLYFLDPETFAEVGRISVQDQGVPIVDLNELEYINGEIFANVWYTNRIARINPQTGLVKSWVDLTGLLTPEEAEDANVLNGIAYDVTNDRLFVTGKLWPKLFEITLTAPYQTMIPVIFNN
ncbi:MAG: glutaminyl-peptide cyclotransferase [Anaerolineales bacterium]|nr:glutaminyl-peptide cyclotransferase [Anaerolineales bacterium]